MNDNARIYWHSELPPVDAEPVGECMIEAASGRVPGTLAHRDELWHECYEDLMIKARTRVAQEISRMGGNCAHILNESVDSKHDAVSGQAWLHGSFDCMIYRQPKDRPAD